MEILTIVLIALFLIGAWLAFGYNGLVRLKTQSQEALADIDVQLKRRYDLIPNLLETVKGYAAHEKETFDRVTQARTAAMGATGVKEQAEANNQLTGALKSLFAVSENYPELKASANFLELQRELTDTEDKVQAARRFYNANVRDLNIKVQSFPDNIIANIFGFKMMELFELADAAQKEAPQVKF
ncbi:MAG: LemA family protein [Candidatus Paceibacterota bacterium]|jgi:LemA protein|nr:LemA family protein [Candidatus Paceibacterota bacterium]MDD4830997.1 LemA family protein [Candidatus Paceibacterota bacterium]MDD4875409.1 LemA family protein [Candidatus Paceibacterota bacterium]